MGLPFVMPTPPRQEKLATPLPAQKDRAELRSDRELDRCWPKSCAGLLVTADGLFHFVSAKERASGRWHDYPDRVCVQQLTSR